MTTHYFEPTHYFTTIGSHPPVLVVADGDTVITTTVDARGRDHTNEVITPAGNPQTGPFYVEGAEPGDTLVVVLDRLVPNRRTGWSSMAVAQNVVDPHTVIDLPRNPDGSRPISFWEIDIPSWTASLASPETSLGHWTLPLAPMLGCFGVAPGGGQILSTGTSGTYGGNMDYRGFVSGVTVYFPVEVPGALLFLGDGHAVQGDGEIVGTGVETSFEVQFTVRVQKGRQIFWPRGENSDYIFTVGNARPLDQCIQHATSEMLRWLQEDNLFLSASPEISQNDNARIKVKLDPLGANLLLGQCVQYDLGNMFDPAYTMVCKVPKRFLPRL